MGHPTGAFSLLLALSTLARAFTGAAANMGRMLIYNLG